MYLPLCVQNTSLNRLPAAFTRARLAELHALHDIDRDSLRKAFGSMWHWGAFCHLINTHIWSALHQHVPWLVGPPADPLATEKGQPMPYSRVMSLRNRHAYVTLVTAAVLVGPFLSALMQCSQRLLGHG